MFQKLATASALLCVITSTPLCHAQSDALNNAAILKLNSSGLSENLIVQTIAANPGHYDTGTDALISLKKAGLSDREVAAMLLKNATPAPSALPADIAVADGTTAPLDPNAKPRLYLQAESHGNGYKAHRDQSMEMSRDFEKNCPAVRISINQSVSDYTVILNHVEAGFSRDNQIQIADKNGDLISRTKEGGSISGDVKKACVSILADWSKKTGQPLVMRQPSGPASASASPTAQ
jgi:hypothetical protein